LQDVTSIHQRQLFAGLLEEKPVTASELQAAVERDNGG
jgi:hypothetical protein